MNYGFYYSILTVDQQVAYKAICCAVKQFLEEVKISSLPVNELRKVCMAITYDHPELFYWTPSLGAYKDSKLALKYRFSKEEASCLIQKFREKREEIILECAQEANSMEELLAKVYHYLAKNVVYAADELKEQTSNSWIYDMEGPFLKQRGVCLGIAQTWGYICQYLEVPHILVTGEAKLGGVTMKHAWNLVQLNGKYRHVDVTSQIYESESKDYSYFLLQDWELNERKWSEDTYPAAV